MGRRQDPDRYSYTTVVESLSSAAHLVKRAADHTQKIKDPARRAAALRRLDEGVEALRMYACPQQGYTDPCTTLTSLKQPAEVDTMKATKPTERRKP